MSLSAIVGTAAASASSAVDFHPHGHKRGVHIDSSTGPTQETTGSTPATTQGLFSSLLSTLTQVVGTVHPLVGAAIAALTPAAAPAAAPASTATSQADTSQNAQTFLHSLFVALKADGLDSVATPAPVAASTSSAATGATATSSTAAGASVAASGASNVGQYEGGLASSLQTLIHQIGSGSSASSTPATADLSASFNNLLQSVNGTSASGTTTQSSNQTLTTFLNNLLQTVQSNGGHSLSALGSSVDAKV